MAEIILKGHKVCGGKAEGEALVTREPISFLGGVNPLTGIVTDKNHEISGASVTGKILIFPEEKGSSAGAYQLYEMVRCHTAPGGMINLRAGPIVAVGAIISDIPIVDRLEPDPFELIETGDWVSIDADKGIVKIKKRADYTPSVNDVKQR